MQTIDIIMTNKGFIFTWMGSEYLNLTELVAKKLGCPSSKKPFSKTAYEFEKYSGNQCSDYHLPQQM